MAQETYTDKHIKVALRMIGHRMLLESNDNVSRVLPITSSENRYQITFENHLSIQPEVLIKSTTEELIKASIGTGYIVEVFDCKNQELQYSFQKGNITEEDIFPCMERTLPTDCYVIELTIQGLTIAPRKVVQESSSYLYFIFLFLLVVVGLIYWLLKSRKKESEKDTKTEEITLGIFQFNPLTNILTSKDQSEELTGKEGELLKLLLERKNTTIERDTILQLVWGDEGDYVGRTLDVFISKLRKRLESDPTIKIINIRGVGYKLVIE